MEPVREAANALTAEQTRLLDEHSANRRSKLKLVLVLSTALASLLTLLLVGVNVLTFRELRARRRVETELGAARDTALVSARTKSEFLATRP